MINYAGMVLTHRSFDEAYSRMARTRPCQGSVFRLYYSPVLDTNVFFSSQNAFERAHEKLMLTLIGEKAFAPLKLVKKEYQHGTLHPGSL